MAKLILLHALIGAGIIAPLVLVPFAARIGPLAWSRWLPPLHQGLAARFQSIIRPIDILIWAVVLIATSWLAPVILIAPFLIACWGWHVRRMLGGISGDGHGAGIELLESGLLLSLIIFGQLQ